MLVPRGEQRVSFHVGPPANPTSSVRVLCRTIPTGYPLAVKNKKARAALRARDYPHMRLTSCGVFFWYNTRMDLSAQLKSLSHHAYCIVGAEEARAELISILEKKHKIPARGNPDFFDRAYDSFGIDDARAVKSQAETRPVHGSGKKIFILTMSAITSEAQNALLKLLEEPPEYAHIFLVLPSAHLLLPTVKSRLSMLDVGKAIGRNGYIKSDITAADNDA